MIYFWKLILHMSLGSFYLTQEAIAKSTQSEFPYCTSTYNTVCLPGEITAYEIEAVLVPYVYLARFSDHKKHLFD